MTKLFEIEKQNKDDKFVIRKSDLSTVNNGHTDANSNCRFKGITIVWEILFENESHFYVKSKKEAKAIIQWANLEKADWDGTGDLEAYWYGNKNSWKFIKD